MHKCRRKSAQIRPVSCPPSDIAPLAARRPFFARLAAF